MCLCVSFLLQKKETECAFLTAKKAEMKRRLRELKAKGEEPALDKLQVTLTGLEERVAAMAAGTGSKECRKCDARRAEKRSRERGAATATIASPPANLSSPPGEEREQERSVTVG